MKKYAPCRAYFLHDTITEQSALASWSGLVDGYSQSKWVGDALAREAQARGMPVAIYRLGAVTGDHTHAAALAGGGRKVRYAGSMTGQRPLLPSCLLRKKQ